MSKMGWYWACIRSFHGILKYKLFRINWRKRVAFISSHSSLTSYILIFTSYPRNIHSKKFWTLGIPTRKILNLRNTHEKKCRTNEIPTRRNFGPTKYPRDKKN